MNTSKTFFLFIILATLSISSCKKDEDTSSHSSSDPRTKYVGSYLTNDSIYFNSVETNNYIDYNSGYNIKVEKAATSGDLLLINMWEQADTVIASLDGTNIDVAPQTIGNNKYVGTGNFVTTFDTISNTTTIKININSNDNEGLASMIHLEHGIKQ